MDAGDDVEDTLVDSLFRAFVGTLEVHEVARQEEPNKGRRLVLVNDRVDRSQLLSRDWAGYRLWILSPAMWGQRENLADAAPMFRGAVVKSWARTSGHDDVTSRIEHLTLTSFRRFAWARMSFHEGMNLFIGKNGTGKTTVLDALARGLALATQAMTGNIYPGGPQSIWPLPEDTLIASKDIHLIRAEKGGATIAERKLPATVAVTAQILGRSGQWESSITHAGNSLSPGVGRSYRSVELGDALQAAVQNGFDVTLPLIAYYRTGRAWNTPTDKTPETQEPSRLAAYEGCLDPSVRVGNMRGWFRRMELLALQDGRIPPVLEASKQAILGCLEGCDLIRYDARLDDLAARFADTGVLLGFDQLSDGQRNMLGMVADMAYRAATLNPHLGAEAPQKTPGIVLIDEIDLHLHPAWQRRVIADLTRVFPKVQFIVTTHSPQILAEVPKEAILILEDSGAYSPAAPTEGRDSNAILREILKVSPRPEAVAAELSRVSEMLDDGEITKARGLLNSLAERLTERDPDVNRLRILLDVTERIDAGDHEGA